MTTTISVPVRGKQPGAMPAGTCCLLCQTGFEGSGVQESRLKWHKEGYVIITPPGAKPTFLHIHLVRVVLGHQVPVGHVVHHKNGIRHDNRLCNLQVVPRAVNSQARRKFGKCSSSYMGVSRTSSGKFHVVIRYNRQDCNLGQFENEQEAARTYDRVALAIHGREAGTNGLLSPEEEASILAAPGDHLPAPLVASPRSMANKARVQAAMLDPGGVLGPMTRLPDGTPFIKLGKSKHAAAHGQIALVSEDGWRQAAMFRWGLNLVGGKAYVGGKVLGPDGNWTYQRLHRFLMNCQSHDGRIIDHINSNTLDNRKSNLRDSTASGNARNRSSRPGSSSKYRGVSWVSNIGKWRAAIGVNHKNRHLGYFDKEDDAAAAYQQAAADLEAVEYPGFYRVS